MNQRPICYTFRRCPYAIRARMTLDYSRTEVVYREIVFRNKPPEMLKISPKGTVPVLQLEDGTVLEESWDIMKWAVTNNDSNNDPQNWLPSSTEKRESMEQLIYKNDVEFKFSLDKYKYADRHPAHSRAEYRQQCEAFLCLLEQKLAASRFLLGDHLSLADIGVFPFIRQFSMVEEGWLKSSPYPHLHNWLALLLESDRFKRIMDKKPLWAFA